MTDIYIGLMSGTSMDGIDAVAVRFEKNKLKVLGHFEGKIPAELKEAVLSISENDRKISLDEFAHLNIAFGHCFAETTLELLHTQKLTADNIIAIGSHGQTIRHCPPNNNPARPAFSLQIGDPNHIAELTGITTVADFRTRDIAAGGQGAPLVPAFHLHAFASDTENRIILNIGGIANITVLPSQTSHTIGFDTGPGNALLDAWTQQAFNRAYDLDGQLAAKGKVIPALLNQLMNDSYFANPPPKSTGREYFNLEWLNPFKNELTNHDPHDVLATLTELTAKTVAESICEQAANTHALFVCGGGTHNHYLIERLKSYLPAVTIESTSTLGIDPDFVEAIAFAWLAKQTMQGKPGNVPSVTGAKHPVILGGIYKV